MDIKGLLLQLPVSPGIYKMKNKTGTIIYVGKAKNLKARVSQYFQKSKDHSPKVSDMVKHIASFEYITTDTELEAFLLECSTIKELKPKYNSQLKNYKGYHYIRLTATEQYPRLTKVTQIKEDGSIYFGPFTSEGSVDCSIQYINDYFRIRKCSTGSIAKNSSGCLNFHMGTCLGPCRGTDIISDYTSNINDVISFLTGKDPSPVKKLKEYMTSAAEKMDFEEAMKYRNQLRGINHVLNKQKVISTSLNRRNIIAAEKFGDSMAKLFLFKGNKLIHKEIIDLQRADTSEFADKLRELTLTAFFSSQPPVSTTEDKSNTSCILNQEDIDEAQIIYSYLKKKNNGISSFNIPSYSPAADSTDFYKIAGLIARS